MRRIGVAVEEFDTAGRGADDGVVDFAADRDRAGGNGGVADAFRHGDQVGLHAEEFAGRVGAQAAKAGDDFVENQQDAVLFSDGAQFFQIALGGD